MILGNHLRNSCWSWSSLTVGTYSMGNSFWVYVIRRQVLPTIPSPTQVIFRGLKFVAILMLSVSSAAAPYPLQKHIHMKGGGWVTRSPSFLLLLLLQLLHPRLVFFLRTHCTLFIVFPLFFFSLHSCQCTRAIHGLIFTESRPLERFRDIFFLLLPHPNCRCTALVVKCLSLSLFQLLHTSTECE